MLIFTFLLCSCCLFSNLRGEEEDVLKEDVLEKLFEDYDNFLIPQEDTSKPIPIGVALYVLDMNPRENKKLYDHFFADIIIQQKWYDYRLKHDFSNQSITTSGDFINYIWQPDTRIMTEKRSYPVQITKKNKQMVIYPNGTVFTQHRTRSLNFCKMDFSTFPFDSQICEFRLESYSYSIDYLSLNWMHADPKKNLVFIRDPHLEQLQVSHFHTFEVNFTYPGNGSGSHKQLVVLFQMTRPTSFYLIRLYLPNIITVIISWTSFWVDYRSLSARVTIGITTVLTINELRLNIYKDVTSAGSYLNLYDIYSFVCFFFVFAALIEYSIAQSIDIKYRLHDFYKARLGMKPDDEVLDYEDTVEQNISGASTTEQMEIPTQNFDGILKKLSFTYIDYRHSIVRDKYHALDKISRYVFPLTFVCISVFYGAMVVYFRRVDQSKADGFQPVSWELSELP